jgi:hypothetical protein
MQQRKKDTAATESKTALHDRSWPTGNCEVTESNVTKQECLLHCKP